MNIYWIYQIIHWIFQLITLAVIAQVVLTYFMDPYHPIRQQLDRFVGPLLEPIRRVVPPVNNIDFSPIVLIILIQILDAILKSIILAL